MPLYLYKIIGFDHFLLSHAHAHTHIRIKTQTQHTMVITTHLQKEFFKNFSFAIFEIFKFGSFENFSSSLKKSSFVGKRVAPYNFGFWAHLRPPICFKRFLMFVHLCLHPPKQSVFNSVFFTLSHFLIIRYARTLKHLEKIFTFRVLVFYLEKYLQ